MAALPNIPLVRDLNAAQAGKPVGYSLAAAPSTSIPSYLTPSQKASQLASSAAASGAGVSQAQSEYAALLKQIQALSAPKPFTYSTFDTAGNSARARAAAEGAVNPLYQKKLSDFLGQQQVLQQRKQADTDLANQQLQQALTDTLSANTLSGQRAGEDTQNKVNDINTQSDQFQQDSGTTFDRARTALLGTTAASGLTGSGLGAQQEQAAVTDRNTQEGRQAQSFNQAKDQAQVLKSRTLADLGTASEQATRKTGEGTSANSLDLNRYIQDLNTQTEQQKNVLEQQRLMDVLNQQNQYEKSGFNQFLDTLSGQNRANTAQVYAGRY